VPLELLAAIYQEINIAVGDIVEVIRQFADKENDVVIPLDPDVNAPV